MGATPVSEGVVFRVWAPSAATVEVELTATGEYAPLAAAGDKDNRKIK